MARRSFTLNGIAGLTQKGASALVRGVIFMAKDRQPLAGDDLAIAADLLALHPERERLVRNGIAGFIVRPHAVYGHRTIFVVDDFGGETDLGWKAALGFCNGATDFVRACRTAISADIVAAKAAHFNGRTIAPCALTGAPMGWDEAHVDHAPPHEFKDIVAAFVAEHGELGTESHGSGDIVIADEADRARFRAFHNRHARLQVISKTAHVSPERRALSSKREEV